MRFKTKRYAKLAVTSLIATFSFGLAITCVSNHKQNINKVFAEDISTTWSYNETNKTLSCTYASNYPNGFIMETNQEAVRGVGDGEYELDYHVLGYPSNNVQPDYTDYGVFTLTFSGSYDSTPSTDGPYGSITASPLDVSGLNSNSQYEIYLKVAPTGDMNQQGSESIYYDNGAFYSRDAGDSDPLVLSSIKFYGDITYENGSADLVFVNGNSDNAGTLRMSYIEFSSKPEGDGSYYSGNISGTLESTSQQVENYYSNGALFWDEEVFNPNSVTWGWDDSARVYSYDYIGDSTGTITTYKALFLPHSGASGEDQIICEYTQGSGIANVRTTIYNHNNGDPIETGMTKSFEFILSKEPSLAGDAYEFQFGTTVLYTFSIDAIYVSIVEEQAPDPPALSALEWYFNEDMGYFSTNPYNDGYYSFSLNTNIVSVIYDRTNATVTANCIVQAAEGNMPEEYYDAQISFVYTNAFGSVVEQVWYFNDAQCETTIEDKENLHFSVDQVSFTKLGWYYEEDLRYYIEENVEASWNIDHCEYRKEGNRDEFILYMDVVYNDDHIFPNFDAIQINRPDFDDSPYPGQIYIGTGVSGWCDRLQQYITISCNSVPFAYYGNGWSYDAYNSTLVYISSEDIELEYELTSVDIDGNYYNLTYTADGDSQTIVVSNASYYDEVLTGNVTLYDGGESVGVSLNIPESMVDPGSAYDYGWTYEEENQKLVYYDPDYGVYTLVRAVNNVMDKVATLTYGSPEGDNPSQTMTIDIDFSGGTGGYDYSANTVSGYARLQGESSTAEYITVLLKNKDGNTINVDGANTWAYDGAGILWINASSNAVPIDELRDNMTGSTFYLAEDTSNQYCEIDYTYDGRVLPTLTIDQATYEEHELDDNEGVEYIVSGKFEHLDESSVTVTIPGEFWNPRSPIPDYVVSFDANGGQGQMESESITAPSDGGSVSYPLPECQFTRDGYNFVGWGITSETTDTIQPEETFDLSGNQTFYAIWSEVTREYTFNITFQDGGATGGSMEDVTITSTTYEYEYTLPTCGYEKEGYEFAGWIYLSSGTSTKYQPGDTCILDCDLTNTFLATWSAGEFVTITFNANGGEGTMEPISVQNGSTQTVPGCDFTYEGYDFVEWAVGSPTSPIATFKPGDSVTVSDNYTLYAVWEEAVSSEIVVNFDPNGGDGVMEAITVVDGVIIVPECDFEWADHTFLYWTNEEGTMYAPGQRIEGIEESFTLFAQWKISDKPVPAADPIKEETIEEINNALDNMDLSDEQKESINNKIIENQEYISDDTGVVISEAVNGTVLDADPEIAEAQKELVVTVIETAVEVDAGKASDIQQAQKIDKALPESADFSVEGEINEFYARQMYELFGGQAPVTKGRTRSEAPSYSIDVHSEGETTDQKIKYLENEQELYGKMVSFVNTGVEHMGKAALKLRVCSGESVVVQVKSYVTVVKVSSFREFDQAAADAEFVDAVYEAILLSMQNEVISILEKDHKPSSNAEKEQQYQRELEAVKDIETFKIMVAEVLRLKYNSIVEADKQIDDVEDFMPIYMEIFTAWALDKPSEYGITLEELTKATIDSSTSKARNFTVNSNLSTGEWIFIGGVAGGAILAITAAAVTPTLLKKKREKEGLN